MITFWRDIPLTDKEELLVNELERGHREAAERQNISTEVLKAAYIGSGDFLKSVVAAISTLGGTHAPIMQAYSFLKSGSVYIGEGNKIPGWGNSFIKGKPDPSWRIINDYIRREFTNMAYRIGYVTDLLHELHKNIYPNAACYTAATAIILGLPKELSPWLVIQARLPVWAQLIHDTQRQASPQELRNIGA